ncbi:MAG: hypothetical protein WCJ89_08035 [Actinomycetes bacterium]
MRSVRLVAIAALVGAISMAPTELRSADAASSALATSASGATSVSTVTYGAVATGSAGVSTGSSSYVLPAFAASCTASNVTTGTASTGSTQINLANATTGLVVGMLVTGSAGIQAGSRIVSIKSNPTRNIVISKPLTATWATGRGVTGSGCWQQYFSVNNIRALQLKSFGISQTVSAGSSTDTITLQSCAGTWTEATGACSGAISSIVATAPSATSAITTVVNTLVATTGTMRLRALATINGITSTISISIRANTDLRNAVSSNT